MDFRARRRCHVATCHHTTCAVDRLRCSCISLYFQKDVVRPRGVLEPLKNKRIACPTAHTPLIDNKQLFGELSNRDFSPEQRILRAANWYARNRPTIVGAFVPILREGFGLSALQAIEAAKLARHIQEQGAG